MSLNIMIPLASHCAIYLLRAKFKHHVTFQEILLRVPYTPLPSLSSYKLSFLAFDGQMLLFRLMCVFLLGIVSLDS
jgi:hypothetical protein